MRLLLLFIALAVTLAIPFLIWGEGFEAMWTPERLAAVGPWAWALGLALLAADLLMPTPSTVVMSGLGLIYGIWLGGLLAAAGVVLSGVLGYGLCRLAGEKMAVRLVGERDFARVQAMLGRFGPLIVAASRWIPLVSETVSCLAGLTGMPFRRFLTALVCGALPLGLTFAAVGRLGIDRPATALGISALAPPLIWLVFARHFFTPPSKTDGEGDETRKFT